MTKKSAPKPLTPKEKGILEFIQSFLNNQGVAPSFTEIKEHFGFASYNSVQRYLKQLVTKNYIHLPGGNQKRAITIIHSADYMASHLREVEKIGTSSPSIKPRSNGFRSDSPSLMVPLLGKVAAGIPLEAHMDNEYFEAPPQLVKAPDKTFALLVQGDSMIEDGIFDGDTLLIESTSLALSGQIVVAVVDNEATVKRIFFHKKSANGLPQIELRPSNSTMKSMWYPQNQVEVKGRPVGLVRSMS